MRVLLQRVLEASVSIGGETNATIGKGCLILIGIESEDNREDINWLVKKVLGMRIFSDKEGKMNLSISDIDGDVLVVSQFTLHASTKKGNRPSFIRAANPSIAIPLYEQFIKHLQDGLEKEVATGEFGADMKVSLINDGPVTIWLDSKKKE